MYHIIDEYCLKSKNLYNYSNYIVRQSFITEGKHIPYIDLTRMIKHDPPFKEIGSNSGQHTLRLLDQNWRSYFVAIQDYNKYPNKYLGKPKIPGYLNKDGRFVWVLTNLQSKIIEDNLVFSFKPLKKFNGLIKTKVKDKHLQTRFIPKKAYYILEIVFQKDIPLLQEKYHRIIGIDLGVNNFATIQNNFKEIPFAINGCQIKSINQYYNKNISKQMKVSRTQNNMLWTKKMQKLTDKRANKIDYFLHLASKYIVNYCVAFKVDVVVIGYNKRWKQKLNMGQSNQQFVYIPYNDFVNKLEYKLRTEGIRVIKTEESYTSKASFLDGDSFSSDIASGKRIKRGMYQSKDGTLINADVNGAGNIIKKVFPNAFVDGIEGVGLHPVIVNVLRS